MNVPDQSAPVASNGPEPRKLSAEKAVEIVFQTAIESAINAFLFILMGSVAFSIVSSVARDMVPGLPPGMGFGKGWGTSWLSVFKEYRYVLVFGVIFATRVFFRLTDHGKPRDESKPASRLQKIGERLSAEWFGLIVGNAFGAMISAMVLVWVQKFTLTKMVLGWMLGWVAPVLQQFGNWALGVAMTERVGDWISWYNQNQFRFVFWFLYLALVCDDLGIPNFKTLARWALRRIRSRREGRKERMKDYEG